MASVNTPFEVKLQSAVRSMRKVIITAMLSALLEFIDQTFA